MHLISWTDYHWRSYLQFLHRKTQLLSFQKAQHSKHVLAYKELEWWHSNRTSSTWAWLRGLQSCQARVPAVTQTMISFFTPPKNRTNFSPFSATQRWSSCSPRTAWANCRTHTGRVVSFFKRRTVFAFFTPGFLKILFLWRAIKQGLPPERKEHL